MIWSNPFANKWVSGKVCSARGGAPAPGPLLPPDLAISLTLGVSLPTPRLCLGPFRTQPRPRPLDKGQGGAVPHGPLPENKARPPGSLVLSGTRWRAGGDRPRGWGESGPGAQPWPETPATPTTEDIQSRDAGPLPATHPPNNLLALGSAHRDIPMSPT